MKINFSHNGEAQETSITDEVGNALHVGGLHFDVSGDHPRGTTTLQLVSSGNLRVEGTHATFKVTHPADGHPREVKRIEFADGSTWEPES